MSDRELTYLADFTEEMAPGSTAKYKLDTLSGVYWESVWSSIPASSSDLVGRRRESNFSTGPVFLTYRFQDGKKCSKYHFAGVFAGVIVRVSYTNFCCVQYQGSQILINAFFHPWHRRIAALWAARFRTSCSTALFVSNVRVVSFQRW